MKERTRLNHPPAVNVPADNLPLTAPIYQNVKFEYREKGSDNPWVESSTIAYATQQVQETMRPQTPRAAAPMSAEDRLKFDQALSAQAPRMCQSAMGGRPCTPEELASFTEMIRQQYLSGGSQNPGELAVPDETDDDIINDLRY